MAIRIKLKGWDIVVLPEEGKVLGRLQRDGTRKEIFTCKTKDGYYRGNNKNYPEAIRSRLIWLAVNGPIPEGMQINHKNHDTSDDRIDNLELVTPQQNTMYRRKIKINTSGYKGVHFHVRNNKYQAYIRLNYKRKHLGYFACSIEAAVAYDKAALELHGKHAILNFPDGSPV
jgi:hypothetical protein